MHIAKQHLGAFVATKKKGTFWFSQPWHETYGAWRNQTMKPCTDAQIAHAYVDSLCWHLGNPTVSDCQPLIILSASAGRPTNQMNCFPRNNQSISANSVAPHVYVNLPEDTPDSLPPQQFVLSRFRLKLKQVRPPHHSHRYRRRLL
jgi:hypothetical protein